MRRNEKGRKKFYLTLGFSLFFVLAIGLERSIAGPTLFQKVRADTLSKLGQVPKPDKPIKIGAIPITLANPFWVTVKEGYENTANEFGVQIDVHAVPQENSITAQLDILENLVAKGYHAISAHSITPHNLIPGLVKARGKGIPVVTDGRVDLKAAKEAGADPIVIRLVDFYGQGKIGASYITKELKKSGGGNVAIIEGLPGAPQSEARKNGAKDIFTKEPTLNLISVQPGSWDRMKAFNITTNLLQANPGLKGIFCANDVMALAAVEAVESAGKKGQVIIVGVDFIPQTRKAIEEGRLAGSVAQSPFLVGEMCGRTAIAAVIKKEIPQDMFIPIVMVTKENIQQMGDWK
jgi:D-allose transport system substrate-binding protein